ncbi:adenylate/guanylate cyclase domain-containing protein [Mycobacterium bourgelatii]|nr:adenylate/guanylate cyclase domain-containing protein [Mycobacterium bourgelatii]MCV6974884.1 adenylate/guanylate cyclase domain-containing protein [Mycobacterium bourgelatii]
MRWLRGRNQRPGVVSIVRAARRKLPGDPEFGDPLSTAGPGAPSAVARTADRLLRSRDAASREVSLGVLQVLQALSDSVSRRIVNEEVTLVFTDLVGFSSWAYEAGDDATVALLRQVASAVETPLLGVRGQVVKRLGDGIMAVVSDPTAAVRAVVAAEAAIKEVEVQGYRPRMRVGIHTGRPQRLGSDWLGVDVNIAARVMEHASKGGIMISGPALDLIAQQDLDELGLYAKRAPRPISVSKVTGIPPDLAIYRLKSSSDSTAVLCGDCC